MSVQVSETAQMSEFYPNSCFVCHTIGKLKRCSRCNMISYCRKDHQLEHWPKHKSFCNEIATIMKEQNISHLYQNLQDLDSESWKIQAELLVDELEDRLSRAVLPIELEILMFPRVCFVCREARQELLRNCPGCPAVSFCIKHQKSPLHDKNCPKFKKIHEMNTQADLRKQHVFLERIIAIIQNINVDPSSKRPLSMEEFLEEYIKPSVDLSENETIFLSDNCDVQLTIYNVLKKLDYSDSEIIIHIEGILSDTIDNSKYWEVLFHLLPHLKMIKIVLVEVEFVREVILCESCNSSQKKLSMESNTLPYLDYMKTKDFEEPDLLVFLNVNPEILEYDLLIPWQVKMARCRELNCSLVFTSSSETEPTELKRILRSTFENTQICYEGVNKFGSFSYFRNWDAGISLPNHFLIVINPPKDRKFSSDFFYAGYCAVCFSEGASVACENCKMVFYCGEAHRNKDLSRHQDICDVVSKILRENGGRRLFGTLKTDQKSWLKDKIDLMLEVKAKLGRELMNYEKEMFLFPKTCFICHESDIKLLTTCECGVSLCAKHEKDPRHDQLCQFFILAFELSTISKPPSLQGVIRAEPGMPMPNSINDFIASFYQFNEENTQKSIFHLQKMILSNLLTRPLTFLYALKKLNLPTDSLLVVHVIGATGLEVGTYAYWTPVFFLLERLQILKIIFIGPEAFSANYYLDTFFSESGCSRMEEVNLKVESHALKYEEYCESKSFVEPSLVLGFNLNLHESGFGIRECTWKDTFRALKKMKVPFVLTAGTENRARADHERVCGLVGLSVRHCCFERNPFAGFIPERDFETEELLYSNQYVIAYDGFDK
ncbi:uncharacterized protein LOC117173325 [Belonocnema kinseyi]|uniref:uncharacterized protein LOC117173325 n=1 Tax=Belonocnema kinseyi TaxID=2817044 RepID=UPI00143D44B6|nr:uncharacterized protein LOC117173325 [Belonocnema kinseyi]